MCDSGTKFEFNLIFSEQNLRLDLLICTKTTTKHLNWTLSDSVYIQLDGFLESSVSGSAER